jgi:acetyl-CoA carboxylase carboxyltransferase component
MRKRIKERYAEQMDIRFGAARGWVDAIIPPHTTRAVVSEFLQLLKKKPLTPKSFHTGIIQV